MLSSTSHSKVQVPWLALGLLATALAAWGAAAVYTLHLNPEVVFFKHAARVKHEWAQKLDREHPHKVVVFGGSSCGVTIDGERLLERHGVPTINLGLGAGMGAEVLTRYALQETRSGDTLIAALEPQLLTDTTEPTALGIHFCFATGRIGLLKEAGSFSQLSSMLALRPGAYHVFTLLGKIASGQPLYRYSSADIRPSGWQQITIKREFDGPPGRGPNLSPSARKLLTSLRSWCAQNDVRVAYAMPWGYTPEDKLAQFQKDNLNFMLQVSDFLPVLKDPLLGANTNRDLYADTNWHLAPEGAALRTDELAREIKHWNIWRPDELKTLTNVAN